MRGILASSERRPSPSRRCAPGPSLSPLKRGEGDWLIVPEQPLEQFLPLVPDHLARLIAGLLIAERLADLIGDLALDFGFPKNLAPFDGLTGNGFRKDSELG